MPEYRLTRIIVRHSNMTFEMQMFINPGYHFRKSNKDSRQAPVCVQRPEPIDNAHQSGCFLANVSLQG